jgi:hypothetical protein
MATVESGQRRMGVCNYRGQGSQRAVQPKTKHESGASDVIQLFKRFALREGVVPAQYLQCPLVLYNSKQCQWWPLVIYCDKQCLYSCQETSSRKLQRCKHLASIASLSVLRRQYKIQALIKVISYEKTLLQSQNEYIKGVRRKVEISVYQIYKQFLLKHDNKSKPAVLTDKQTA